ncbi:MAG: type II toxin-antitoxin system RelE/ParE family toxin [Thermomicrobiales bacterium]|nr:type II toxin-antitoxin system RelE/ParE family toxin [Thermomicrobiales bacterium]
MVFSVEARLDLSDILLYTEQQWGREQRNAYQATIRDAVATIARNPHITSERHWPL